MTSMMLDAAMTNCLFAHGTVALTAELRIRFRESVQVGRMATVKARIVRRSGPLSLLEAEVLQDGRIRANAEGKFMTRPAEGGGVG